LSNTHHSPYTEFVAEMTDCIIWHKSIRNTGYGQTYFRGKVMKAHKAAWIEANGEVPEGFVLDHICHNEAVEHGECKGGFTCKHRACVNLDHLRLASQSENVMAGIHNIDNRSRCNQGHLFEGNIMVRKSGKRECAECNRVRARAVWAKKKVAI
jgi:hypothetical protein